MLFVKVVRVVMLVIVGVAMVAVDVAFVSEFFLKIWNGGGDGGSDGESDSGGGGGSDS